MYTAFGNSPLNYGDPLGLVVTYETEDLRKFYEKWAVRNEEVEKTLKLYAGALNLHVKYGDPVFDDGTPKGGEFTVSREAQVPEYDQAALKSALARGEVDVFMPETAKYLSTIKFRNDAEIEIRKGETERTKLHELGHADHYARDPLGYYKAGYEPDIDPALDYENTPTEKYAIDYEQRVRTAKKRKKP